MHGPLHVFARITNRRWSFYFHKNKKLPIYQTYKVQIKEDSKLKWQMLGVRACTLTPNPGTGVQPLGHNGNVSKRLFSFRLYEPLTCHLICLKSNKDISTHRMKSIYWHTGSGICCAKLMHWIIQDYLIHILTFVIDHIINYTGWHWITDLWICKYSTFAFNAF